MLIQQGVHQLPDLRQVLGIIAQRVHDLRIIDLEGQIIPVIDHRILFDDLGHVPRNRLHESQHRADIELQRVIRRHHVRTPVQCIDPPGQRDEELLVILLDLVLQKEMD